MNKVYKVKMVNRFNKKFVVDFLIEAVSREDAKQKANKEYKREPLLYAESATTNFKYMKAS